MRYASEDMLGRMLMVDKLTFLIVPAEVTPADGTLLIREDFSGEVRSLRAFNSSILTRPPIPEPIFGLRSPRQALNLPIMVGEWRKNCRVGS
jgi:hypothetical protein